MKNKRSFFMGVGFGLVLSAVVVTAGTLFDFETEDLADKPKTGQEQAAVLDNNVNSQKDSNSGNLDKDEQVLPQQQANVKEIEITKGSTASEIAELLLEKDVINEKQKFLQLVYKLEVSGDFIAGTYQIPSGLSEQKVIELLIK